MDLATIISIATLVVIYIGGTILAVRLTTNVMSNTIVNTLGLKLPSSLATFTRLNKKRWVTLQ